MWVLALDTTTRDGSVALVRDGAIVVERPGDPAWSHAERLPADLRAVLEAVGLALHAIDLVAVATGPGAFTGLRIGLAAAQGLALALGKPAAGVSSLAAIAWHVLDTHPAIDTAGAWLDASRGEVYGAVFGRPGGAETWPLTAVVPPTSAAPLETLRAWTGPLAPGRPIGLAPPTHDAAVREAGFTPVAAPPRLAGVIGRLGAAMHAQGRSGPPAALAPEYVRRPDVELARDRQRDVPPA